MAEKMTVRKRQAQEMRRRIQKAALDLFDKEGFENVSVEQVAQAVGCSVGNIYHYYKSKDELALQVTDNVDRQYRELEQAYAADTARAAHEKLLDFLCQALQISAADELLCKSFIQGLKYPEQGALKGGEKRVYHRVLRTLVSACQQEGSISTAYTTEEVVQMLVAFHRGLLFEWRVYEHEFDPVARGHMMAQVLLKGLR